MLQRMPDTADPQTWASVVNGLRDIGIMGGLLIALVAGYKGWVLSRREADNQVQAVELRLADERADKLAIQAERDEWKKLSLELLTQAQRATSLVERVVK